MTTTLPGGWAAAPRWRFMIAGPRCPVLVRRPGRANGPVDRRHRGGLGRRERPAPTWEQMALVLQNNEYVALFAVSQPTWGANRGAGRGSGDPRIELRDEAGSVVLSDDDSGGAGAARAETQLQPGRYCLSMTSYDGSPMSGFRARRTDRARGAHQDGGGWRPPRSLPTPRSPSIRCSPSTKGWEAAPAMRPRSRRTCPTRRSTCRSPRRRFTQTATVDEVPNWGFVLTQPTPCPSPPRTRRRPAHHALRRVRLLPRRERRLGRAQRAHRHGDAAPARHLLHRHGALSTGPSPSRSAWRPMTPRPRRSACTTGARRRPRSTAPIP
jgi:hypothetical protein